MNIENNYNMLGSLNSSKVIEKLQHVDWDIWTHRQDSFKVHKKTINSQIKDKQYFLVLFLLNS